MPGNRPEHAGEQRAGHKTLVSRLEAMGIAMSLLPGGTCAVGELTLRSDPFPGIDGPLEFGRVRFASVGSGQLKCLAPEALFQLPTIPIASCSAPTQIEDRIRASWARHIQALREAGERLDQIGVEKRPECGGGGLAFSLGLEDAAADARCLDKAHVVLPSRGPLSGTPVPGANARIADLEPGHESSIDLEIALTGRLEELAHLAERADRKRRQAVGIGGPERPALVQAAAVSPRIQGVRPRRAGRILLVGAILGRDQALRGKLVGAGFQVRVEYSIAEALAAFTDQTFDAVLTDAHLGRSEGLELIPEIAALPGIEHLPIVLVDEHARAKRKETARSLGAAGYLVHPIEAARVVPGIARMAAGHRGRRFSRVDHQLDVAWPGAAHGFTRSIGRGGMFTRAQPGLRLPEISTCAIALPALGEPIRVATRTVYRQDAAGLAETGLGIQIYGFPDRNESRWIEYLTDLLGPPTD